MTNQTTMKVLREEMVPPAGYFAAEIHKCQVLRIVDVEGILRSGAVPAVPTTIQPEEGTR